MEGRQELKAGSDPRTALVAVVCWHKVYLSIPRCGSSVCGLDLIAQGLLDRTSGHGAATLPWLPSSVGS